MYITDIYIDGYRNLKEISVKPHKNINIIAGNNAQGKTNFIEALWILSGCRSFRGAKEKDFIAFSGSRAQIDIAFQDAVREQKISFLFDREEKAKKLMKLNGVTLKTTYSLYENFLCIAFTPDSLDLVKGSPDVRRHFIDMCISQVKPRYIGYLNRLSTILAQRNAVIRRIAEGSGREEELELWNEPLAAVSAYISVMRALYINVVNTHISRLLKYITDENDHVCAEYISSVYHADEESIAQRYRELLENSVKTDIRYAHTTAGVHRDDISILLGGKKAREIASQGQARSIAIAMKLAQAEILSERGGSPPVLFLDDVFSELDAKRQSRIMRFAEDMQVFITCCNQMPLKTENSKVFEMKAGRLTEE